MLFPKQTIIKTKYFDAHQDWDVPIPGFFILALIREGVKSVADFNEQEAQEFTKLLLKIRQGMKEVLGIEDVYLFQNEDSDHGFHLCFFPRHKWMDKFGRKIESVRTIINYAKENMLSEKTANEVKESVAKMKSFMENFNKLSL